MRSLRQLVESQYQRNDMELAAGRFPGARGYPGSFPAYEDNMGYRISFFGDEVERITESTH